MPSFRVLAARFVVVAAVGIFVAHSLYGLYLARKLAVLAGPRRRAGAARWDPANYPPEARPWLARDRRWRRSRTWVWLGSILGADVLYYVLTQ